MKKYIYTLSMMLMATIAIAQVDEARMERDLEVASTVLSSLLNSQGLMHWNGVNGEAKGKYIEGYGVVIFMPNNHLFFGNVPIPPNPQGGKAFYYNYDGGNIEIDEDVDFEDEIEFIIKEEKELSKEQEREFEARVEEKVARAKELASREKEIAEKAERIAHKTIRFLRLDSLKSENNEKQLEKMKIFLVDYAHLISQLKANEKILVVDKNAYSDDFPSLGTPDRMKKTRLSAEITMKDVLDFQKGKISREEVLSKIVINKNDQPKKVYKDLELMKSMINRLYSTDLSDTYYSNGSVGYEVIEDIGAIFYLKTVSSTKGPDGLWYVPTQERDGLNQERRNELIKSLYPKFEQQLKENILDYGRTVNSLKDNEQLIFNVKITQCEGCEIPSFLELSISAKDLKDYNSSKLNKEQALERFKVKRGAMQ